MDEGRTPAERPAHDALTARWHLAVVSGPDPGWCLPVRRPAADIGRDPGSDLALADPRMSRRHLQVRERRGWVEVRDLGSANGTRVRRVRRALPWRRARASRLTTVLGRRWRRLAPGSDLLAGASVLRVRSRPGLAGVEVPETGRARAADRLGGGSRAAVGAASSPGSAHEEPSGSRSPAPVLLALSGLPFLVTAATTGSRLAFVAAVPLLMALAALRSRRPRTSRTPSPEDPAAVLLRAARGSSPAHAAGMRHDDTHRRVDVAGVALDPFVEGPLALVGPASVGRAAARWLVAQLATEHDDAALAVVLQGDCAEEWASALPHAATRVGDAGRVLIVLEGGRATALPRCPRISADGCTAVVVLVERIEDVPPWCRRVVEVAASGDRLVSAAWAAHVVATLAHSRAPQAELPTSVAVTDLLADPEAGWSRHDDRLAATFCVGTGGALEIDLARDGPHALVAGTSGSGKSELLLCWVLALACRYPPSALAVVAVDYKGGATFGPLAGLPHLDALLTDLDAMGTARALAGLRSELARREAVLAAAAARDLGEYRRRRAAARSPDRPLPDLPRLLVVVDEFRALADDHPDLLAGFVRLAAQGRSLGIHLVLATQRPAGAVSGDLRANLGITVCLRVLTGSDSRDVLGHDGAARLPALPGRAFVHGIPPVLDPGRSGTGRGAGSERGWPSAGPAELVQAAWSVSDAVVAEQVARVTAAARRHGYTRGAPLWAPALPARVRSGEARRARPAPDPEGSALPLLLTDLPGGSELVEWAWSPLRSALLVAGGSASGRSTAVLTAATAAADRGWTVHLVHGAPAASAPGWAALATRPEVGTVVGAADPRRLVRLLELLEDARGPALVCVDDVEAVLAAVDQMRGAPGIERLGRFLRDARTAGIGVVVSGSVEAATARWASAARHRILLGALDGAQASIAGVPRDLVLARPPAGRGVLLGDGPPVQAQVLLPAARPGGSSAATGERRPRLRAVPLLVTRDEVLARWQAPRREPGPGRGSCETVCRIALGLGGDSGGVVPLEVPAAGRVVIAGPPESGRSSVLRWIGDQRRHCGCDTLLVDDADLLPAAEADSIARQWRTSPAAIIVTVRTDALAGGYGGVLSLIREARQVLLLAPLRGGVAHLNAAEVLPHADPGAPRHPGRGVLVTPRCSTIVQAPRW